MDYVLNVQNAHVFASCLRKQEDITKSAAAKMAETLDRRVVDADDLTHYEEIAFHSEFVSASPIGDVTGPNTVVGDGYAVSTR